MKNILPYLISINNLIKINCIFKIKLLTLINLKNENNNFILYYHIYYLL